MFGRLVTADVKVKTMKDGDKQLNSEKRGSGWGVPWCLFGRLVTADVKAKTMKDGDKQLSSAKRGWGWGWRGACLVD